MSCTSRRSVASSRTRLSILCRPVLAIAALGILVCQAANAQTLGPVSPLTPELRAEKPAPDIQPSTLSDRTETFDERPFWTFRKVVLLSGLGASITAGALAWSGEVDLRARKRQIQALPAGVSDEWDRQLADAQAVLNARNFWGAVAVGVGSVTTIYALTSRPPHVNVVGPTPGTISRRAKRTWDVRFHPVMPRVSVAWSF